MAARSTSFPSAGALGPAGSLGKNLKDTTQRKAFMIQVLEKEMQEKMSLVHSLEAEKQELLRKERLLQLEVSTKEHALSCQSAGLIPNLVALLKSFRSNVNKMLAGKLLDQISPQASLKMDGVLLVWRTYMDEVTALVAEWGSQPTGSRPPEAEERAAELTEGIQNWVMSLCLMHPTLVPELKTINILTGETFMPPIEFWAQIVDNLGMTDDQLSLLQAALDLFTKLHAEAVTEQAGLTAGLNAAVQEDLQRKRYGSENALGEAYPTAESSIYHEKASEREKYLLKLQANLRRVHMLNYMCAFMVLRVMTPWQKCTMVVQSCPSFPNLKLILAAACMQLKAKQEKAKQEQQLLQQQQHQQQVLAAGSKRPSGSRSRNSLIKEEKDS